MSNCLDCDPSGLWGGAATPHSPTGFFRSLWQAQDAMGCPRRTFPAFAADCCGFKHRGDRWDAYLWAQLTECMSGGNPAAAAELGLRANHSLADMAAGVDADWGAIIGPGFWWWATFISIDATGWVAFMGHDVPGHTDLYDLRTLAHFTNFPGGYDPLWRSTGRYYVISATSWVGAPWLNAI